MSKLYRGLIIDVDLEPTKGSETGKTRPCKSKICLFGLK